MQFDVSAVGHARPYEEYKICQGFGRSQHNRFSGAGTRTLCTPSRCVADLSKMGRGPRDGWLFAGLILLLAGLLERGCRGKRNRAWRHRDRARGSAAGVRGDRCGRGLASLVGDDFPSMIVFAVISVGVLILWAA